MSDLLAVVTRNRDDIEDIEEYVAREQGGAGRRPDRAAACRRLTRRRRRRVAADSRRMARVIGGGGAVWSGCLRRPACSRPATGSTSSPATCRWRRPRPSPPRSGTPTWPCPRTGSSAWSARVVRRVRRRWRRGSRAAEAGAMRAPAREVFTAPQDDPWWRAAVSALDQVAPPPGTPTPGRSCAGGRDAASTWRWLAARVEELGGTSPGSTCRAAAPGGRRGRQLLRPRRAAAGRGPVGARRCAGQVVSSSRSAWSAGGWTRPARRTSSRARTTSSSAAPTQRGRVEPHARHPQTAAEILDRAPRLVPALRTPGCCGTRWVCARRGRRSASSGSATSCTATGTAAPASR